MSSAAGNRAGIFADFNADGLLDLLAAGDCYRDSTSPGDEAACNAPEPIVLYRWLGGVKRLINENGTGFRDATAAAGLEQGATEPWQAVAWDTNADGFQDLFLAIDHAPNQLWINDGNAVFEDRAVDAGLANAFNDMGIALGDMDNDGDFDLYVSNISDQASNPGKRNVLYTNESRGDRLSFEELAQAADLDGDDNIVLTGNAPPCGWGSSVVFLATMFYALRSPRPFLRRSE
ncbi:MAG: FG-GAP repeat domain-containing protein [Planctomycetota bacterium]